MAASLLVAACAAQASDPPGAEYAIRWDPAEGGPSSAAQTFAKLEVTADKKGDYEVGYRRPSAPPPGLPEGFAPIVRERWKTGPNKKEYELTYKQRGPSPSPATPTLDQWPCPVGKTKDRKDEVDVSFRSLNDAARAYSRSCTVESKTAPPPVPAALKAPPAKCTSTMTRLKRGELTVEEWHLRSGRTLIEVSRSGAATDQDFASFQADVARKLIETHGIKPLQASMTELASACGT
ncbi:hypothetical protein A8M77_33830 [Variovorax sp. JS1663]|nr:hypothetical protein A8M77_33830 [Variovorax sp. JS1663]